MARHREAERPGVKAVPEFETVNFGTLPSVFYGKVFCITQTTVKQDFPRKGSLF